MPQRWAELSERDLSRIWDLVRIAVAFPIHGARKDSSLEERMRIRRVTNDDRGRTSSQNRVKGINLLAEFMEKIRRVGGEKTITGRTSTMTTGLEMALEAIRVAGELETLTREWG